MLTTPRAIVLAAALVAAALLGASLFPRYDIQQSGPLILRIDRWTGTVQMTTRESVPVPWLIYYPPVIP